MDIWQVKAALWERNAHQQEERAIAYEAAFSALSADHEELQAVHEKLLAEHERLASSIWESEDELLNVRSGTIPELKDATESEHNTGTDDNPLSSVDVGESSVTSDDDSEPGQ